MRTLRLYALLIAMCFTVAAQASVSYGDFGGGSEVGFLDVTETTTTADPEPLYGAPTLISPGVLHFNPLLFVADAPAGDTTGSLLTMTITAPEGEYLSTISIAEIGDYATLGVGAVVQAMFGAIIAQGPGTANVITTADDAWHSSLAPGFMFGHGFWTLDGVIDLSQYEVESVVLTLDNNLLAAAPAEAASYIQKKGLTITVTHVPEPATLFLLGAGTVLLAHRRSLRALTR
ncbi:MAG: PEP-CTERM sorting domain-containing protein [Phycisphaeraceae bacterium]|nr:PEP-CTERM sorting domain-containing protein [Phycisphaeraceae bacterium]